VSETQDTQTQTEQVKVEVPSQPSRRKSVLALAVFALGLNATAAVYTHSPSDFSLPTAGIALPALSRLAELLPDLGYPTPKEPDPVIAALKEIQSVQLQQAASLFENSSALSQSAALRQQDTTTLLGLRQSLADEQSDIKKISSQLSKLMAKVDMLQSAITPEVTSSLGKSRARRLYSLNQRKLARQAKPVGPVSTGGAPLTIAPVQSLPSPES